MDNIPSQTHLKSWVIDIFHTVPIEIVSKGEDELTSVISDKDSHLRGHGIFEGWLIREKRDPAEIAENGEIKSIADKRCG